MAASAAAPSDLVDVKLIAMAAILAAAAAGSLAGICLHHVPPARAPNWVSSLHKCCCGNVRHRTREAFASYAYLLSGGVLTAAALVHLLPDASEGLEDAVPGFPLAHFLSGVGFFVTMAIEEGASRLSGGQATAAQLHAGTAAAAVGGGGGGGGAGREGVGPAGAASRSQSESEPDCVASVSAAGAEDGVFGAAHPAPDRPPPGAGMASASAGGVSSGGSGSRPRTSPRAPAAASEDGGGGASIALLHGVTLSVGDNAQWAVAVLVLGCLSFHSFVAGAALGVSQRPREVMDILVAIIAHKGLATSALVTAMLRGGATWRVLLSLTIFFACVTPAGVALGMVAQLGLSDSPVTAGLLAFASGTFLHVGVVEMIVHELQARSGSHGDRHGLDRGRSGIAASLAAAFAGFVGMGVLAAWV